MAARLIDYNGATTGYDDTLTCEEWVSAEGP